MVSSSHTFFPSTEPICEYRLRVSERHQIRVLEYGNNAGKPAVVLHGGPGAGVDPLLVRCHDPSAYRIVTFDQRGCGASTPNADLEENTTWHLLDDMEKIRIHLGIERWQVVGGSWGSTLALAYAEEFPDRVHELIVRGIFTLRRKELEWFYQEGASHIFPEAWEDFLAPIPPAERQDMIAAYHRRLIGPDDQERLAAATAWSKWEAITVTMRLDPTRVAAFTAPAYATAFARIECHYFQNGGFFSRDDQLLHRAGALADTRGVIIQGRYDICTPMSTAWDLHKAWPKAEFRVVADSGHALSEPGIVDALVSATEAFK